MPRSRRERLLDPGESKNSEGRMFPLTPELREFSSKQLQRTRHTAARNEQRDFFGVPSGRKTDQGLLHQCCGLVFLFPLFTSWIVQAAQAWKASFESAGRRH